MGAQRREKSLFLAGFRRDFTWKVDFHQDLKDRGFWKQSLARPFCALWHSGISHTENRGVVCRIGGHREKRVGDPCRQKNVKLWEMDRFVRGGGEVRLIETFGSGHVKLGEDVSIYHNGDVKAVVGVCLWSSDSRPGVGNVDLELFA